MRLKGKGKKRAGDGEWKERWGRNMQGGSKRSYVLQNSVAT